ncbi:carbohydrate kinase family protein [Reichenbachiella versicolor]|uniref:carbohydrate kinase family protein n=1 Tax=Reichenbachiella versicolor TaxID=1821036 RepID=UPI000D6DE361|nr:carbohydrate kinase family protein [Reichenbachiella versicolor]
MEVICSGLNVVDLLISVPAQVPRGEKTACDQIIIQGGAPAGNAACALAKLGHETGFLGYFGDNTLSHIAQTELTKHGVKTDFFINKSAATPAIAVVEVDDEGERTVMYSIKNYRQVSPEDIDITKIKKAKLLLVDGYDIDTNTHLLKIAKRHGIKSILDLETSDRKAMIEMIQLATNPILPLEAAQNLTNKDTAEDCLHELIKMTDGQVIITDGANGSYTLNNGILIHQEAFKTKVVDTTGCGDSFHAAYASALLQGKGLEDRLVYASFYASQVAQHFGGRTFLPDRDFMDEHCPVLNKI